MKRLLSALLAALLSVSMLAVVASAESDNTAGTTAKDSSSDEIIDYHKGISYQEYTKKYGSFARGTSEVLIDASMITKKTAGVKINNNYKGDTGMSVYTGNDDEVEFTFNAKEGRYNLFLDYYTEKGKNISIERALYINGELPFKTADNFTFNRVWVDKINSGDAFAKDAYGNDIRPTQEELNTWTSSYFYDYLGYTSTPLEFYFKEGKNTIKLASVKEPMTIKSIKLVPATEILSYDKVKAEYESKGYANYSGEEIFIQAERPTVKSDQTLYPMADLSTPSTVPFQSYKMLINEIGGTRWQYAQQAITWTVKVDKSGLYKINFKARKNLYQGMISSRKLYINGEVPFSEAEAIPFKFDNDWVMVSPTTDSGEDCLVYLEGGKDNTVTLETTQGEMGPYLRDAEESLSIINEIYRKILIVTGSDPDKYRDYKLDELMPDVIKEMDIQAQKLDAIVAGIVSFTGKKGSDLATLDTMSRQLKKMHKKPEDIPKNLSYFKTNIGSLGTWLNSAKNAPLELDYISLSQPETKIKKPNSGFFTDLTYQVNQFIASFVVDYNSIGNITKDVDKNDTITVWISTGRDQFQTLRAMINDKLTKVTGQEVNLELVNMGALLSAVVAGIGPDVALGQVQNEAVNYALRNAVLDLSQFEGTQPEGQRFSDVEKRFSKEALVPYYFNNGKTTGVYAVPETQTFNVMFYRKDILSELGIAVPQTWEDIITAITTLNKNNLEFGMPVPTTADAGSGLMMYYSLLRQCGGDMYAKDTLATSLNTDAATTAFKKWTNFYVNYGLPLQFDFQNRFRTGEMPLGIGNYGLYNTLSVAAPEIRGLWDFTIIPGTLKEDGTIDRSNTLVTSCALILSSTKKRDLSWKFLEWWTRAETQSQYGSELECILGPSARYGTANTEAFERLPWTADEIATLKKQLSTSYSIPEVPGGYFLQRHINNAFRRVVYKSEDPKDTLLDYSNTINAEITNKRKEFGLPVRADS